MTPRDTAEAIDLLGRAAGPADLFGPDPGQAARRYRELARLLHPDTAGDTAAQAFVTLTGLWRAYGQGTATIITTRRHIYQVGARVARGDLADLHAVTARGEAALLKLPRNPANNDLIEREAAALRRLRQDGEARLRPYVPGLVESFRHRDVATGTVRAANVITRAEGFHSLARVSEVHPSGLDPRDAAWMWRRLLVALGFAHRAGVLHGAVLPEHVLIHPERHGLVLVDWCYSVTGDHSPADPGGRVPAMVTRYADWYPTEVGGKEPASPGTDLAMAARCLLHLVKDHAPKPFALFAKGCLHPASSRRPDDAWRLLAEFDDLLERLYGPRRFRPFTMPETP